VIGKAIAVLFAVVGHVIAQNDTAWPLHDDGLNKVVQWYVKVSI
jgi:hypothetical protein